MISPLRITLCPKCKQKTGSPLFLSQIHLHTDANERIVMIKAYLSLQAGGHTLDQEDKKLILQAIFRHVPAGLVKDDAAPGGLQELLTRLGK